MWSLTLRLDDLQAAGQPLTHADTGMPLAAADRPVVTANAYLGGWGIAAALAAGADVVVCPRVTDASLAVGPAAWWHGWRRDDWDALAGAVAAGHVIECGPQATGGNYSFLEEVTDRRYPGFPIAEIAADGSSVITKHDGTGGLVSVGTVTAQLLYEIGDPNYLNPDVTAHFGTIQLAQAGPDRVAVTGTRGSPPPDTLKVALNMLGGYRNTTTMVLTGLDIEAKAAHAEKLLFDLLGGADQFDEVDVRLLRFGPRRSGLRMATPGADRGPVARTAHRGRPPRCAALRAAEPPRTQLRRGRPARPRRSGHHPAGRPGQGPGGVPPLPRRLCSAGRGRGGQRRMTAAPRQRAQQARAASDGHIQVVRAAADWPNVVPFWS
jgi:hypothetical protein